MSNNQSISNNQFLMSNNQNQNTMNNNTTIPQEFQYTLEQAIEIVKHSPSSIWRTEDVLNLMNRIKAKELFIEVPIEQEADMEQSIELQEQINGMLELIEDMDTSIEAIESSVDNISIDESDIQLSFYGREVILDNIDIDGKAIALSDVATLRQEMKELKSKIQQFGKEVCNG